MHRRLLLAGSCLPLIPPAWADASWPLVSPDEVRRDQAAQGVTVQKRRALPPPDAPRILVDQPTGATVLHPPVSIRVRFAAAGDAAIDLSAFHASYVFLGLDITARLLQHARLTPKGLEADNVAIPAGDHRVTLTIADNKARQTSETFLFKVV